jgi:hypothetical protein
LAAPRRVTCGAVSPLEVISVRGARIRVIHLYMFLPRFALLPLSVFLSFQASGAPTTGQASAILRGLPILFEANEGRWDAGVKFAARTGDSRLFLTARGASLTVNQRTVSISLLNANPNPEIFGVDALPVRTNYLLGSKKENWRTVANYARVRYRAVYPGVDLVYYGSGSELEYDFLVRPGADPNRIRLQFKGIASMKITPQGDLQVETAGARMIQRIPVVYQERPGGSRREIHGKFKLLGRNVVGFEIEPYDRSLALTIDPVLKYSSLIGGSGSDAVTAVKIDKAGMLYVTGYMTNANDVNGDDTVFRPTAAGGADIFVAKINPALSGPASLLYFTFIGGSGSDIPNAIALDDFGNVYLTGSTTSQNFPLGGVTPSAGLNGVQDLSIANIPDAFVLKLQPALKAGDSLLYSTYLGGGQADAGNAIDVDAQGNIYVTGYTRSDNFQITSSAYQNVRWGNQDAFVVKLNPDLPAPLIYSTYLGGEVSDEGRAILVGPNGAVYVAANTFSKDFPLAGFPYRFSQGGGDIVIFRMDLTKSGVDSLVYGTYLGGSGLDEVRRLALDSRGRLLLAGTTLSDDFPVTADAVKSTLTGIANVFVARLDLSAQGESVLSYSTYLGGSGGDVAYDMATDVAGNAYVTGYTLSTDFPTTPDALQLAPAGGIEVFISKLSLADAKPALTYSTYVGKSGTNVGYAIAVAPDGAVCVGGQSSIRSIAATESAFQSESTGGVSDGFILVLK